jgi:MFS transporter, DHA1 family, multidrug resistance protein
LQLNFWLLKKIQSIEIFRTALSLQIFISIIISVLAIGGAANLVSTTVLFILVLSCIGSIMPNVTALALAPFKQNI